MAPVPLPLELSAGRIAALLPDDGLPPALQVPGCTPSSVLRAIACLDVPAEDIGAPRIRLPSGPWPTAGKTIPDLRAAVVYVPLSGALPLVATDELTVSDTVSDVSRYRSQIRRGNSPAAALQAFHDALNALELPEALAHRPWAQLEPHVEVPCTLIALVLSSAPQAILLDGTPCEDAARRIAQALESFSVAALWACDEDTAQRVNADSICLRRIICRAENGHCGVRDSTTIPQRSLRRTVPQSKDPETSVPSQFSRYTDISPSILMWMAVAVSCAVTPVRASVYQFATASHNIVMNTVQTLAHAGPTPVSAMQLAICSILVLLVAGVSWQYDVGLESKFLVASVRCVIQLSLLGIILVPIFRQNAWWQVIGYIAIMMLVAAQDCASRPPYIFRSKVPMYFWILASFGSTTIVLITFVLFVVLRVGLRAIEAIPIGGMVMNSCLSSTAVALSNSLSTLAERKDSVEILLSLGATRFEASRPLVRRSVILGMTSIISLMATSGIVSMSGMMTGQLLGGADPTTAARYQIIVMFLLSSSTFSCTMLASILSVIAVVDGDHRIRSERIVAQENHGSLADTIGNAISVLSRLLKWRRTVKIEGTPLGVRPANSSSYGTMNNDTPGLAGRAQLKSSGSAC